MEKGQIEEEIDSDVEIKEEELSSDDETAKVKEEMESDAEEESKRDLKEEQKKLYKPGIIYLSKIPPKMNVKQVRDYFSQFGEVKRSFLQPESKS